MISEDEYDYGADPEESEYSTGPFCVHWGDPGDCELQCENCGHACCKHGGGFCECYVTGCACMKFIDGDTKDD